MNAKPRADGFSIGASIDTGLRLFDRYGVTLGYERSQTDAQQSYPTIDPGAGKTLVIPGPTGTTSGFSLGSFGGLNVVKDAHYDWSAIRNGGTIGLNRKFHSLGLGISIDLSARIGYDGVRTKETFSGSIPGFARDFSYGSTVDVHHVTASITADPKVAISLGNKDTGDVYLGGTLTLSAVHSQASGMDMLRFTGFPDSMRALSGDGFGAGYRAGVRLGWDSPGNWGAEIGVGYGGEPGAPVIERDGTDPSRLKLDYFHTFYAGLQVRARY